MNGLLYRPLLGLLPVVLGLIGFGWSPPAGDTSSPRERLVADFGWRFHLGDEWGPAENLAKAGSGFGPASLEFGDASWRRVDLPHDWAVELPFDSQADGSHGFKALGHGFSQNSVGWYRRTFESPPSDAGRRIWLEFDGVFRDSTVFVNGWLAGHHQSGYGSFRYDITDVIDVGGKNVISVRVDASQSEGWFYEGAGIYRHVWLVKVAPLAVEPDGVFVYSRFKDNVPVGPAELHLQARLNNTADKRAETNVTFTVLGPDGKTAATARRTVTVAARGSLAVDQTTYVNAPVLWSPEAPTLYRLVTSVAAAGTVTDQVSTEFGIRTVAFDPDKGFLLNGKPYVIKGTCNHQDHAGVGAALPDRLQYFRIAALKKMGANAYRTAHNPPTPELLEACDRLGMLVMDENRRLGSDPLHLQWLEEFVRRDRNHPSVVVWSIANEEFGVEGTPAGRQVAATMQDTIKRLDPTRPVTYNAPVGNRFTGINEIIDVRGWSYHIGQDMDDYHAAHPKQSNVGSEQGSTVSTRGIYANDKQRGYVSAYDDNATSWSNTAKQWWSFFAQRRWLSGGFVWTGFDYRGEPTPYSWPCINSHFGILDTCGFPKDNFWNYQSWWTEKPVLHLLPHWNWAGREGQNIDVRALSNSDEVELLLDGVSLGRQNMQRASELKWSVRYRPGTLSAKGYRRGQLVAETKVETTGAPAAVRLAPDRPNLDADGEDVAIVTISVVDDRDRVVPVAGNAIALKIEGPGRIIGVGNGDPSSHDADKFVVSPTVRTRAIDDWRWTKVRDSYAPNLAEVGAHFDDSHWEKVDVRQPRGPLVPTDRSVFRAKFSISAEDLAAAGLELWFGKIEGDGSIFLNGQRLGRTGSPRAPSVYDAKALLHRGENTVAVTLANWSDAGGLCDGVMVRLIDNPQPPAWSRSVFNGLAQVIVQTTGKSGTIKLTAESKALAPATLMLLAAPAAGRPALR